MDVGNHNFVEPYSYITSDEEQDWDLKDKPDEDVKRIKPIEPIPEPFPEPVW
jgi:hypothetical protein